jgi:tRNA(His) 5'-end guanylyltransferase
MNDSLGDRIKAYEARETDRRAMKGVPLVARVDGRSFSRFTRGMARPFDNDFADLMVEVAKYLVEQTHARVAYVQSDEVTIVLDPFALKNSEDGGRARDGGFGDTDFMFGGRLQKLNSVLAGLATARFMKDAVRLWPDRCDKQLPVFDARVFEVPNREEAAWSVAWREFDAVKNAVSMACRAHYGPNEMLGKSSSEMQEMLFQKGINFNDYPARFKRGSYIQRKAFLKDLPPEILARIPEGRRPAGPVMRKETIVLDLPPIRKISNWVEVLLDGADPAAPAATEAMDAHQSR